MAVKTPVFATPNESVTIVFGPVKLPVAPVAGGVNVTVAPVTRFPY